MSSFGHKSGRAQNKILHAQSTHFLYSPHNFTTMASLKTEPRFKKLFQSLLHASHDGWTVESAAKASINELLLHKLSAIGALAGEDARLVGRKRITAEFVQTAADKELDGVAFAGARAIEDLVTEAAATRALSAFSVGQISADAKRELRIVISKLAVFLVHQAFSEAQRAFSKQKNAPQRVRAEHVHAVLKRYNLQARMH